MLAGVSVAALGMAGMLMPSQHQRAGGPFDLACSQAANGATSSSQPSPASAAEYELCLSVTPASGAPVTAGSKVNYSIKVWLASLSKAGSTTVTIPATVTLQPGTGDPTLQWTSANCPDANDPAACSVAAVPLGPPDPKNILQAQLTIPASAAGSLITFTVTAADAKQPPPTVQPASEAVSVPVVTPSPTPTGTPTSTPTATPTPTPTPGGTNSPTPTPTATPTRTHSHSPSPTPTPTPARSHSHSPAPARSGGGPGSGSRPGSPGGSRSGEKSIDGTNTALASGFPTVGASLPPGFSYPPTPYAGGSIGNLPGQLAPSNVPTPSFPQVTPEPSAPRPVVMPRPQSARMANVSADYPLDRRLIGAQVAGLAALAAAVTIAVAKLSLRRRASRSGKK